MRMVRFAPEEYYHVYNRGIEKRTVFLGPKDYERFLSLLYLCNSKTRIHRSDFFQKDYIEIFSIERGERLVDIGAFCLMSNHFHLLLRERVEGGISAFMQKITTAYTMYFNKKNNRSGSLFQGVFKAEHCNNDRYLNYLFAYIHLNPVLDRDSDTSQTYTKEEIMIAKESLISYRYSSFLEYLMPRNRPEQVILITEEFPEYFKDTSFEDFVDNWLLYYQKLSRRSLDNNTTETVSE